MSLPPVIWLAGEPGFQQWDWVRGVMSAHRAGVVHQILVVREGLPHPNITLGARVEAIPLNDLEAREYPGMLGTFQWGLVALGDRFPGPVFLALASRPGASSRTYERLAEELETSGVPSIKPSCGGRHGHPVLLGPEVRARAASLSPTVARVRDLLLDPLSLDVEDPGILAAERDEQAG